jgi:hypothetical protein
MTADAERDELRKQLRDIEADRIEDNTAWYRLVRSAVSGTVSFERRSKPQPGDIVIEISRWSKIDFTMIGTLERIEDDPNEWPIYYVTGLNGEKQRWVNCEARTVQIP